MIIRIVKMCLILFVLVSLNTLYAQDKKTFKYVGVKGCKACHMVKKIGAQYKVWKTMKHSKAYETLASEKALTIGKKEGIADPQKSEKCLKCHTTGYGADASLFGKKYTLEEGVSCEACHGPGSEYKSKKVQVAVAAGTLDPATVGLIKPDEKVCIKCHNKKSPTFTEFNFKESFAKISHPRPEK